MPIFDQGYRAYDGPIKRSSRALAIAWESIRPRMRWWIWILLFFFVVWPYLVHAVLVLVFYAMPSERGTPKFPTSDVVYGPGSGFRPDRLLASLQTGDSRLFWSLLNDSMMVGWPLFLTAIAAAGTLASDRRTSALQIYFSRPVIRRDYLLGKLASAAFFGLLLTAIPSLLVWMECALLSDNRSYALQTAWFPPAILAASLVYSLWCAALVLFLSALLDRPVVVGLFSIFSFLFLHGLGAMLAQVFGDKAWRLISPPFALGGATAPLFGMECPDWMPWWRCVLVGIGVPVLMLAFVWRRVRAVEVVT